MLVGVDSGSDGPCTSFMVREAAPLIDTSPLTAPADLGANVTVKVVLWPAAKVTGRVSPLTANAALLAEAWDTVRLVAPEFVKLAVRA